jgi:hypothetical protein
VEAVLRRKERREDLVGGCEEEEEEEVNVVDGGVKIGLVVEEAIMVVGIFVFERGCVLLLRSFSLLLIEILNPN